MDFGEHHQVRSVPGLLSGDFVLTENLEKCWTDYTEGNEENFFRKFVSGFVNAWHLQVCPNWELLVTSYLQHGRHSEKTIQRLPDELLPAISKFLFVAKDDVEQGRVSVKNVTQMREIVQSLVSQSPPSLFVDDKFPVCHFPYCTKSSFAVPLWKSVNWR